MCVNCVMDIVFVCNFISLAVSSFPIIKEYRSYIYCV